jgi:hypothetical protein
VAYDIYAYFYFGTGRTVQFRNIYSVLYGYWFIFHNVLYFIMLDLELVHFKCTQQNSRCIPEPLKLDVDDAGVVDLLRPDLAMASKAVLEVVLGDRAIVYASDDDSLRVAGAGRVFDASYLRTAKRQWTEFVKLKSLPCLSSFSRQIPLRPG